MRILFTLSNGSGRVLPAIGVLQSLRAMGHDVAVVFLPGRYAAPAVIEHLQRTGIEIFDIPAPVAAPAMVMSLGVNARVFAEQWKQPEQLENLKRHRHLAPVRPQCALLRELVRAWKPALMVVDTLTYQSALAARLENVRHAAFTASLRLAAPRSVIYDSEVKALESERNMLFAEYGIDAVFRGLEYASCPVNPVFTVPELEGVEPFNDTVALVGPSRPRDLRGDEVAFPWELVPTDRPLVYVASGTVLRWETSYVRAVADAIAALGLCGVFSSDLAGTAEAAALPPEVQVFRYVPQVEMLRRAAVFVTAGGANSFNESIDAGVPLLAVDFTADHPIQCEFVARAGIGIATRYDRVTSESCQQQLLRLLEDGTYRRAISTLRNAYRAADGARRAAELIVQAA